MPEFPCTDPIDVEVTTPAGSVTIMAESRDSVVAEVTPAGRGQGSRDAAEATEVLFEDGKLLIKLPEEYRRWSQPAINVEAQVPLESNVVVKVASASIDCQGKFGDADIYSASGDIKLGDMAGETQVHTASGDVAIGDVGGTLVVNSASGDITAGDVAGSVKTRSASGDLKVRSIGSDLSAQSASGDVEVGMISSGEAIARTVSGKVDIAVATGTGVWLDLSSMSGKISNDLETVDSPEGDHELSIHVRTVSGRVNIRRNDDRAAGPVNA